MPLTMLPDNHPMVAFASPLVKGWLVKRYKRFLADVRLETGEVVCAHCPNTGAMLGLTAPDTLVWLSKSENPARKLAYTWEMVQEPDTGLIGVNTHTPNVLVKHAILNHVLPEFKGYAYCKPEVVVEKGTRLDFLLAPSVEASKNLKACCYVEVKNVHFFKDGVAFFPDSPTQRGAKHMSVLEKICTQGGRAMVLYVIQRQDCHTFGLADWIDPVYAAAANKAFKKGVEPIAYSCKLTHEGISFNKRLPIQNIAEVAFNPQVAN